MKVLVAVRRRRCLAIVGVVVCSLSLSSHVVFGQSGSLPADVPQLYPAINGSLRQLLSTIDPASGVTEVASDLSSMFPLVQGDRVAISIQSSDPLATLDALQQLGRTPANVRGAAIEVYASLTDMIALANRPEVWRLDPIMPPFATVTSQGQSVHNATAWIGSGVTGRGVKVGIIDAGFRGILGLTGSELPQNITARCYTALGLSLPLLATCDLLQSNHGTAVAESLYDVAPGVQLYVANPISKVDFANTIDWMVSQGVSIINTSLVWGWDGPGDGTSPYSDSPLRTVDTAIAGGVTYITSAGNAGLATWSGPWRDSDGDGLMEFSSGVASERNSMSVLAGQNMTVQMRWQDSWAAAASDLDIYLLDASGRTIANSSGQQAGRAGNTPSELLTAVAPATATYYIQVARRSGPIPAWIQVQSFDTNQLQYGTPGSIGNPGESRNPGLLAVGAASWQTPTTIEAFSSTGPTPDGRIKPDIVGADQGATVTYGAFGGTSQAAPHVAGLAALVKSAFPAFTPQQVASYLTSNAAARPGGRPNTTWGWGFARLPPVCSVSVSPTAQAFGETGGSVRLTVTAPQTCAWNASSQVPWLTFATPTSGTGSTSATVNVAPNSGAPRTGTLIIGGASVTITQHGPVPPTTYPRNLSASVSGRSVTLSWLAPDTPPSGYVLELGTRAGASDLTTMSVGSMTYYAFEAGDGLYYVRVKAMSGGVASPPSNEVSFRVGAAPAVSGPPPGASPGPAPGPSPQPGDPGAPSHLSASVAGNAVSLTWSPPSAAAGLLGYQLEAGSAPGLSNLVVVTTTTNGLYAPGIGAGVYYVRVRAGTPAGLSAPSNEVAVVVQGPQPPGAPVGLSTIVNGSFVTLRWSPPGTGGAVSQYVMVVGSSPGADDIGRFTAGTATLVNVQAVPRGVYYVRIIAVNPTGSSASSNEAVVRVVG